MLQKTGDYFRKHKKDIIFYIVMAITCYIAVSFMMSGSEPVKVEEISYLEYVELLNNGDIDTVYYNKSSEFMTITLFNEETRNMPYELRKDYSYGTADKRMVRYPGGDAFRESVLSKGADVQHMELSSDVYMNVLSIGISLLFPLVVVIALVKVSQMQNQGIDKKSLIQTSNVKFSDIIGHEEILDDIKFITELIQDPSKGDKIGAKIPKGLLLQGDPGTGKTLIAKAMAGEAGVPFLYQNASSFIEMFVGVGAKRVRDLFRIARKSAPCIIFIDEIDTIGGNRDSNKGTSEHEQTINALLQEMDGFTGRDGVFIIAATNRADQLDPALIRSGRFDRQIVVNPPRDWRVRRELFHHYLDKFTVCDDIDIDNLSKQTTGFTGADIAMVCNEASIIAVMQEKDAIDAGCIEEAIDKKIFKGNRSRREANIRDRNIIAYHESGHAVMSYLLKEPVVRASIQSTVSGVGGAVFNSDKETMLRTNDDLRHSVMIAYAGRASEEIKFGQVTTGASNDITQATNTMIIYVEHMGFDKDFGLLDMNVLSQGHLISGDDTAKKLGAMSVELYDECKDLLKSNYDKVERLAQRLLEVDTVSGDEIERLMTEGES